MNFKKQQKGFTLIELLVVIAIIGLLATLAVVALGNARQRSRDAKRVSDVKQIQTAFELRQIEEENYPWDGDAGVDTWLDIAADSEGICSNVDLSAASCTNPTYMGVIPGDPSGSGTLCVAAATDVCEYAYMQNTADGDSTYQLLFLLETNTGGLNAGIHCTSENGTSQDATCP